MTSKAQSPTRLFNPVRLERVSDKVATQLKTAISDGVLRVGDRIPSERELAEQMGVSRASIREAIQQLELRGILQSIQGGGTTVRNVVEQEIRSPLEALLEDDKQRVLELTEVRAFMEAWAARQAAVHRTPEQLARMRDYLEEMERDLEKGQIRSEVDIRFHTEIAAAARNTIFLHLIDHIYQLITYSIKIHREQVFVTRTAQETIFSHHLRVFKAIQKGDPAGAEAAMKDHLLFVVDEFKKWSVSH